MCFFFLVIELRLFFSLPTSLSCCLYLVHIEGEREREKEAVHSFADKLARVVVVRGLTAPCGGKQYITNISLYNRLSRRRNCASARTSSSSSCKRRSPSSGASTRWWMSTKRPWRSWSACLPACLPACLSACPPACVLVWPLSPSLSLSAHPC